MPIVWTHTYALRPKALLLEELAELLCAGYRWGLAGPQVWTAPSVGGHHYEAEDHDAQTHLKLLFLADLYRSATGEDADSERAEAARKLVDGRELTEAFFDARWTLEDLGPFVSDVESVRDRLRPEEMKAVQGPERLVRSLSGRATSIQDQWQEATEGQPTRREELAESFKDAIVGLCARLGESRVEVRDPHDLRLDLEGRLEAAGVSVERPSRLVVELRVNDRGARSLEFKRFRAAERPRGGTNVRGRVYREYGDGVWTLETVERSPL